MKTAWFDPVVGTLGRWSMLGCCFVGLSGCFEDVTELSIDVMIGGDSLAMFFREIARPDCTCNNGNFPAVGACVGVNDGIVCTCDPGPASCLSRVTALREGKAVGSQAVDPEGIWFGYVGFNTDQEADEIRIEGCGAEVYIALDYVYSTPTITNVVETAEATLRIEWTTSPPAPYEMVSWGSLSGAMCLDEDDGEVTIDLDPYSPSSISVHALALDEVSTSLGDARIWYGNEDELTWPEPN